MAATDRGGVAFDLKNTSLAGLSMVLRTTDVGMLAAAMAERFGSEPAVFDHDPVVLDFANVPPGSPAPDVDALLGLLARHRLRAVGVRGASEIVSAAALRSGLGALADDHGQGVPLARNRAAQAEASPTALSSSINASITPPATPPATPPVDVSAREAPETQPLPVATLIVDKPLRSGQQVYARGGDLVVLATVNVGAEVIADGHIHVYGPLRGKAVAGAKGNTDARIFSTCMEPQLLAIAGTYRTTETPLPSDVVGRPAQIRLDGERLVFEPLG